MRNYAILHIVADEAKIFQTKERAPVLLHFEAFRPEELMLEVGPEKPLSDPTKRSGSDEELNKRGNKNLRNGRNKAVFKSHADVLDLEKYD